MKTVSGARNGIRGISKRIGEGIWEDRLIGEAVECAGAEAAEGGKG